MNLNSNNKNAAEHIQFMEETMAANPDSTWNFVVFHHSIYSAASHSLESDIIKLREDLVPTIDKLDIDAVLSGHDHSYVRTYQMKNLQPLKNQMVNEEDAVVNPDGTVYITGNSSSGSKYYNLKPEHEPYAAVRTQLRTPTFTNVEVTPTSLEFTTYRVDTLEEVDSYKIIKDESIEVKLPALKEVNLKATGSVIPTEPSTFYPEVKFTITGTNVNDGPYDIATDEITYKTDKEGQISISPDGTVTVLDGAVPGEVNVWAEVSHEGKTFETDKITVTVVEHSQETLLEKGSEWKYLDDGSNQETAWKEPTFDDSSWKIGAAPLGYPLTEKRPMFGNIVTTISYGPDSQKKYPTSYFRTEFEIDDLSKVGEVALINFGIDDSVILYLNGHEIARHNLPEGNISFDKYLDDLSGSNVADESAYETFELSKEDLAYLVEGTNVLAAEIHQDRATSSDVYWDMEFVTSTNGVSTDTPMEISKTYNIKNFHAYKLVINTPYSLLNLDETSSIKDGIHIKTSATLKGTGFTNKTVAISPSEQGAIIDLSGVEVQEIRIDNSNVKEFRGAENVKAWVLADGVTLSQMKFLHSNGEEINVEVK